MELSKLSTKPQLIKITINKAELVEKYGEELEFFIYDRQSLDTFAKLANADKGNFEGMTKLIKDMILDKDGNPIIDEERILPVDLMMEAVSLISEELGK